jgi:hypothetical protein
VLAADDLKPELLQRCAELGSDVVGTAACEDYDGAQPCGRRARELRATCGTIVLFGSGGRSGDAGGGQQLLAWLAARGVRGSCVGASAPLNFPQLAEIAGLGYVSPVIGHLLHPVYGPWVVLHGALLLDGEPFGRIQRARLEGFAPCLTCSRPCVTACPGSVYDGAGGADLFRCAQSRHAGPCDCWCASRRACPVGAEHRFTPAQELQQHRETTQRLKREHGLGAWGWVPGRWRE